MLTADLFRAALAGHCDHSDAELLGRFADRRDEAAFEALLHRHGPAVWGLCRRMLPEADAEDVFQATFLELSRKAGSLRRPGSVGAWLYGVAHRLARMTCRGEKRRADRQANSATRRPTEPAEELSLREAQMILDEELAALPKKLRAPVLLCCLGGLSRDEAARRLGWTAGVVKSRLEKARERLRLRLRHRGVTLSAALAFGSLAGGPVPRALGGSTVKAAMAVMPAGTSMLRLAWGAVALVGLAAGFGVALSAGDEQVSPPAEEPNRESPVAKGEPLPDGAIARLGSARMRYAEMPARPTYSPDGKLLAVIAENGLDVWDAETGDKRYRIDFEKDPIRGFREGPVRFRADGEQLAVLLDRDFAVYRADNGEPVRRLNLAGPEYAHCDGISPDLKTLARGDREIGVEFFDSESGELLGRVTVTDAEGVELWPSSIVFTPDGKSAYVSAHGSTTVTRFDLTTFRRTAQFETDQTWVGEPSVTNMVNSPDGNWLATFTRETGSAKRSVLLRNTRTGEATEFLNHGDVNLLGLGIAFSPNSRHLAINFYDGIRIHDVRTGKLVRAVDVPMSIMLTYHPDGQGLAIVERGYVLLQWNLRANRLRPASADPPGVLFIGGFSADGRELLTFGDRVRWWDVRTGRVTRDTDIPAVGWAGGAWLSQDGTVAAVPNLTQLRLFDTRTGEVLRTIDKGGKLYVLRSRLSPDGKLLFVPDDGHEIQVWDATTGKLLRKLNDHTGQVDNLAVSPDGKWLASSEAGYPRADNNRDVRLWEVSTGRLVRRMSPGDGWTNGLAFSPDGRTLAGVGGQGMGRRPGQADDDEDGLVLLWDVATGNRVGHLTGHTDRVTTVTFSPDGRMLATSGWDRTVRIWEVASRRERHRFTSHRDKVLSMAFSPDATMLVTTSTDAPAFVWDIYGRSEADRNLGRPSPAELDSLWDNLAGNDAETAFATIRTLIRHTDATVADFGERLSPARPLSDESLDELLAQLDDPTFAIRERASRELLRHADATPAWLREQARLAESAEVRRRLGVLLASAEKVTPQRLREIRAVEVLGQIRSPAATGLLERLAEGAPSARLTREARSASARRDSDG